MRNADWSHAWIGARFVVAAAALAFVGPAMAKTTTFSGKLADLNPVDGVVDTGVWLWADVASWNLGIPADGDAIRFYKVTNGQPLGVNTRGADLDLAATYMTGDWNNTYKSVVTMYDSDFMTPNYKVTPVPNTLLTGKEDFTPADGFADLIDAANASPPLFISTMSFSRQYNMVFMMPVHAGVISDSGSILTYYGDVTATKGAYFTGRTDTNDSICTYSGFTSPFLTIGPNTHVDAYGPFSVSEATMSISSAHFIGHPSATGHIGTFNLQAGTLDLGPLTINNLNWTSGRANLSAASRITGPASIPSGAILDITAAMSAFPTLTVQAGGILMGDMTGAVYSGPGKNVTLRPDACVGILAGPAPARSDVGGALLVLAVPEFNDNNTVWRAGDSGNSVYKGLLFNEALTGDVLVKGTFQAAPGSGPLQIQIDRYTTNRGFDYGAKFIGDGLANSADFRMTGGDFSIYYPLNIDLPHDGSSADLNRVSTFNFFGDAGQEGRSIVNWTSGARINPGQALTIACGKLGNAQILGAASGQFRGRLVIRADGTMNWNGSQILRRGDVNDTGVVELQDRSILKLGNAALVGNGLLEALAYYGNDPLPRSLDSDRLEYHGTPIIALPSQADIYPNWTANKVLYDLWIHSNIYVAGMYISGRHVTVHGSNLPIGNGKCLIGVSGVEAGFVAASNEQIVLATESVTAGQTPRIGFQSCSSIFRIDMDVSAPTAILEVGSSELTGVPNYATGGGNFMKVVMGDYVDFRRAISAAGLIVRAGTARFYKDLTIPEIDIRTGAFLDFDSGRTARVTARFGGGGIWTLGNGITLESKAILAPGDGIGELSGYSPITLNDGAVYEWEISDPDGRAGKGWDIVEATNIDFDADDDNVGSLTIAIRPHGLLQPISPTDRFAIAIATTGFDIPSTWAIKFDSPLGLDTTGASVFYADTVDIDGDHVADKCLFLTGISGVPEPTSFALLAAAASVVAFRRHGFGRKGSRK